MKKLIISILCLFCLTVEAAPPSTFIFSPFGYAGDYPMIGNNLTTELTTGFPYPDTTHTQTMLSAMPSNLQALTWAFAVGTCGSETWGGVAASTFAPVNVAAFVAAGKKYIVSAGGHGNTFNCGSDVAVKAYMDTYNSANLLGFDIDWEGTGTGGSVAVTINGTSMTCNTGASCSGVTLSPDCVLLSNSTVAGTQIVSGSGANWTLNYSNPSLSISPFISGPTSYTQAQIDSVVHGFAAAQAVYPNARFSFTVGATGGTLASQSLSNYGIMAYNALKKYQLTNYTFNIMTMDFTNDPNYCIQKPDLSGCEMGLSAIQAARNVNAWYGIPFNHIEVTPMIGTNDTTADIYYISDICWVSFYAMNLPLAGIHFWGFSRDRDCPLATAPNDFCNSYGMAGVLGYTKTTLASLGY